MSFFFGIAGMLGLIIGCSLIVRLAVLTDKGKSTIKSKLMNHQYIRT